MPSLLELLAANRDRDPLGLALGRPEGPFLDHASLQDVVLGMGETLRRSGIGGADRVALSLPDALHAAVTFLAVASHAVCAPMNPSYRRAEIEFHFTDLGITALVVAADEKSPAVEVALRLGVPIFRLACDEGGLPSALLPDSIDERLGAVSGPTDQALLLHTSGTTARPKIVPLSHANLVASSHNIARSLALTPQDRCLNVMPLFHIHGLVGALLASLAAGASVALPRAFDPTRFFDWLDASKASWYTAVPAIHQAILAMAPSHAAILARHQLRFARSSSAALPPSAMTALERLFGAPVIEAYGMTEASHQMTANPLPPRMRKAGSVGLSDGAAVAILGEDGRFALHGEQGEICIRGEGVMTAYERNDEANARAFHDGWFRTGDQGLLDVDGYLHISGRLKEMINRGGEKVSPLEVEAALLEHGALTEAAVFSVPHPTLGEDIAAAVVLRPGAVVEEGELRNWLCDFLADAKIPRQIILVEALPRGPTGKVQRLFLARALADRLRAPFEAPRTPAERIFGEIWRDVLEMELIGVFDNFMSLGGDSLKAMMVVSRLRQTYGLEVTLADLFARPTLAELATVTDSGSRAKLPPISAVRRDAVLPLSFAQQRLWYVAQIEGASQAYNIPMGLHLAGELDHVALRRALDRLIARHEGLRTNFQTVDGQPVQQIAEMGRGFDLQDYDLTGINNAEEILRGRIVAEAEAAFDLATDPLIRGRLIRLGPYQHVLLITMHHIVSDGWSRNILVRELGALYAAYCRGESDPLPELPVQYPDYAVWQARWLAGDALHSQRQYWLRTLANAPVLLELPLDRRRPAHQDYRGGVVPLELDEGLTTGLKALSRRHGTTLFTVLLAGWAALLSRLSGQEEVVIGVPAANRGRAEIEALIGFFVNSLAMDIDLSRSPSVRELIGRVAARSIEAQQNQDLPFEQVVEIVRPPRSSAHSPIFQVVFAWQNVGDAALALPGLTVTPVTMASAFAKFDLTLTLGEADGRITGGLEFATALFDRDTIGRHAGYLRNLLQAMVADETQAVDRLPLLDNRERNQLLTGWNVADTMPPPDKCLHQLFEAQAARTPGAIALSHDAARLSYAELNLRANRLAHHLCLQGVTPGTLVAICVERGFDMIVGILAILKAGAAYVPLDPAYPETRLAFVLDDSAPMAVLTDPSTQLRFPAPAAPLIDLTETWRWAEQPDSNPDGASAGLTPSNLAYVIYTSGSTGLPKGVMVEHRHAVRLFSAAQDWFRFDETDVWTLFHSFAFDISVWEIWGALLFGGRLAVVPQRTTRSPLDFYRLLQREGITVLNQTPSAFRQLVTAQQESDGGHRLRHVVFGGEVLDVAALKPWHHDPRNRQTRLTNMYGITETIVHVTLHEVGEADFARPGQSLVGRPLPDLRVYILDRQGEPVPIGVIGEIYVAGAGIARGYLNRPELTAERFVTDPFAGEPGARMYKSGDLARFLPGGDIEYLGRSDFQVKIRGFRIELGEIEARLAVHPRIRDAVVIGREDGGDKRLVAYYTTVPGMDIVDAEALRRYLLTTLPEYMVPAAFVRLDALPLTNNGKLDRKALPTPDGTAYASRSYEAPIGDFERGLAQIWKDVLGLERVGRHDNFFDLGGHSLLAVKMISRLREALGVEASLVDLFAQPALAEFAAASGRGARELAPRITTAKRDGPLPLSFSQQSLWVVAQMEGASQAYHIAAMLRLSGALDQTALRQALDRLVARHEALRTSFGHLDGMPFQRIAPAEVGFDLKVQDLSRGPEVEWELERLAVEETEAAFDLETGPLIRGQLVKLAEDEHVLLITAHHIVSDGWSMAVLFHELGAHYEAYSRGQDDPLPNLAIQYADFVVWQRRWLTESVLQTQGDYWRRTLADAPILLELPTDRHRPPQQDHRGGFLILDFGEQLTSDLKALGRRHGATLFMTILAGWTALMSRLSGQVDVTVGVPVANRGRAELEPLIGFFVNSLAIRLDLSANPSVGELLRRVKVRTLEAQTHQDLPFEQVVEIMRPPRSLAYPPIFQVVFAWQNTDPVDLALAGLTVTSETPPCNSAKFDLSLLLGEKDGRIVGRLEYAKALFDLETVERYAGYLLTLLGSMAADDTQSVDRLPLLGDAERRRLLVDWNATETAHPRDRCLHELFEAQAARTPNSVAIVHHGVERTYADLNADADRFARRLRMAGVEPGALVAIGLDRSIDLVCAQLAILKCGGAYVPLDRNAPPPPPGVRDRG